MGLLEVRLKNQVRYQRWGSDPHFQPFPLGSFRQ